MQGERLLPTLRVVAMTVDATRLHLVIRIVAKIRGIESYLESLHIALRRMQDLRNIPA